MNLTTMLHVIRTKARAIKVKSLHNCVVDSLSNILDPISNTPITECGLVQTVQVDSTHATIVLTITPESYDARKPLLLTCKEAIEAKTGLPTHVVMTAHHPMAASQRGESISPKNAEEEGEAEHKKEPTPHPPHAPMAAILPNRSAVPGPKKPPTGAGDTPKPARNHTPLPHVKRVIAVASGKGGVGKSTTTVHLAHALRQLGQNVGILDADIYGPSIPRMLGLLDKTAPNITEAGMQPHENYGIQTMSMGYITGDQAAVLRAPMITKALQQMLRGVAWGRADAPLDILLIDMPPGTGDITLSLAQNCPLDGVLILTTPQDVAVMDAQKSAHAFEKLGVPLLGIIENMSAMRLADGTTQAIFGTGGGEKLARDTGAPLLGEVPLTPSITTTMDKGAHPFDAADGTPSPWADIRPIYQAIAKALLEPQEPV